MTRSARSNLVSVKPLREAGAHFNGGDGQKLHDKCGEW